MNADHADSIQHYAETLLGRTLRASAEKMPQWLMTGVDAEGCDLRRDAAPLFCAYRGNRGRDARRTGTSGWENEVIKSLKIPLSP